MRKRKGAGKMEDRSRQGQRKGASSTQSALWADDEGDRYSPPWQERSPPHPPLADVARNGAGGQPPAPFMGLAGGCPRAVRKGPRLCFHLLRGFGGIPHPHYQSPIYRSDNVAFSEMIMYHRRESSRPASECEGRGKDRNDPRSETRGRTETL